MEWHREPNAIGRSDYVSGEYRISPREQEADEASVGRHITQWDVSYRGEPIGQENSLREGKLYAERDELARSKRGER